MRPRLLDLFCGAGGSAVGFNRAGFDPHGVDSEPQPNYPYPFHQGDTLEAVETLLAGGSLDFTHQNGNIEWLARADFDAADASPPCQRYCTATGPKRGRHPDLVAPTRDLLMKLGLPWVIENVPSAPLLMPVTLCGSAFGLRVRRHRAFESSEGIAGTGCYHAEQGTPVGVYGQHPDRKQHLRPDGTQRGTKATSLGHGQRAMGIDWMTWAELAESIPPAFSEFIGRQLLDAIEAAA